MTKSTNTVRNFSVVTIQSDTKEPHHDKINKHCQEFQCSNNTVRH